MSGRAVVRTITVIVFALITMFCSVSDIVAPWRPYGVLGVILSPDATVIRVIPHSDAARAGILVGDRIDFGSMTPVERGAFNGATAYGAAGATLLLPVQTVDGRERSVRVSVDVRRRSLADNITDVIECLSFFVSIVLAAVLVLMRPSPMTWSFFAFVLLSCSFAATPVTIESLPIRGGWFLLSRLLYLSWIPLASFALRFPQGSPGAVGRRVERTLLFSLVLLVPVALFVPISWLTGHIDVHVIRVVNQVTTFMPVFGLLLVAAIFAVRYRAASASERMRMRLIIVGFLTGYAGVALDRVILVFVTHERIVWLSNLLLSATLLVPISVAYAIVRHRVLDIRIVVRRAAIYAILTTLVVALLAVMDFLVGKVFESTKIAAFGEIGVAVILGLTLNPLHRRLETAVDAAIFRRRRAGVERLRLIADGLLHANAPSTISRLLVTESTEAFDLASAAVFEANDSGDYARTASVGWVDGTCTVLEHDSSLVLRLIAAAGPLRIMPTDFGEVTALPEDVRSPVLAVPIVFRGELDGFVLFGAHRSGEEIDPEEVASLSSLARSAASAFDHLDAQAMRARLAEFERAGATS